MKGRRLCDCGSAADWAEIGSTWMCVTCRDRDANKKIGELKEAFAEVERVERALQALKVDTRPIAELLSKLKVEINSIEA